MWSQTNHGVVVVSIGLIMINKNLVFSQLGDETHAAQTQTSAIWSNRHFPTLPICSLLFSICSFASAVQTHQESLTPRIERVDSKVSEFNGSLLGDEYDTRSLRTKMKLRRMQNSNIIEVN